MSSCKDQDPTLTPEWFEALISSPSPESPEQSFPYEDTPIVVDGEPGLWAGGGMRPEDMLARKCSRCGAYKDTPESKCSECEE